ncbi:MAG TPA: DNA-3-methyladenine glycosylase 2 family protein [Dehalococcoidia bacterium]|nr:DNA-3-methyladenine glycosylase 2 family protein [Dehalococcoidia bacterium]
MTSGLSFSPGEALAHLSGVDPVLAALIERTPYSQRQSTGEPYAALLRTILFQQLAGAAASAIQRRFFALYGGETPPTPPQLLDSSEEMLRTAGISRQKAGYMHDLALHVVNGTLDFETLPSLTDEEVVQRITAVKGLGEWSAHMFLMFHMGRPDVLPVGDLGVRNGMRVAYGLQETPAPTRAREIGAPWAPFRSVGSWYMWRAVEPTAPTAPEI